ncbi:MAG: response regulator transcription factor [Chloroflexi bacterium]|nr:response regulator transcription factor [Chloroflexota bacterium]
MAHFTMVGFSMETGTKQNPYTVLIVDDVPVVRESLRWLIEDEANNLTVIGEAGDGVEAVRRAVELRPQVVILDVDLPGLDGYAVARQLKVLPHPPVIVFLTVHSDPLSRQRGFEAGGDGFAEKGRGWLTLIDQIHQALASRSAV